MRTTIIAVLLVLLSSLPAAHAGASSVRMPSYAGTPITVNGLQIPARVIGPSITLAVNGTFQARFWAGVNLGSTVPGRSPGEVAATRAQYDRWLTGMGALGARVLRIYTILRPAFYDALLAYNRAHPKAPLYVIQGIWIPEDEFLRTGNAYDATVTQGFKAEIHDAVDVIHGNASLPLRPGHASGMYHSDVSRWVLAFMLGVEWDPDAVMSTDHLNAGTRPFQGRYFTASATASPMESWIASMLDYTAGLEAQRGWSRPLTFTNWVTLDPLHHAYEPLATEDETTIDATHIAATSAWPGGFFATYHVYPYYPDALRFTPEYLNYRRARDGKIDPYAGYLHALRQYHDNQAVMIGEFGVPGGLGIAHVGPDGRDQGNHSEQAMGAIDADMLQDIHDEGYAGGLVFEWIDEWFKLTWNTQDEELPADRSQLWPDALTNEQQFGIVAADPGATQAVTIDGNASEWSHNGSQVIEESSGAVREVRALEDDGYLYLDIQLQHASAWQKHGLTVGFDVRPGGNRGLPGMPGVDPAADMALTVGSGQQASLYQAAWTDPVAFQYGIALHDMSVTPADLQVNSGAWINPRLVISRPLVIPATGQHIPLQLFDYKTLRWGTTNPQSPRFDSRNLIDARGTTIEVRIPWAFLTFSDPSSHQVYVPHPDGTVTSETVGKIGIAVALNQHQLVQTHGFKWHNWNRVQWHERRKAGWGAIATSMKDTSISPTSF